MTQALRKSLLVCMALVVVLSVPIAHTCAAQDPTVPREPQEDIPDLEREKEIKQREMGAYLAERRYQKIIKAHSFEIAPFVGPFLGDALPNSIVYGARTSFFVTERFAVGVDGGFTEAGFDPVTLGTIISQGDRDAYFVTGNLTYHIPNIILPIPEISLSQQTIPATGKILQSDLFVTAGGGLFHALHNDEPVVNIGGGAKIYFNKFVILRIDVRNYLVYSHPPLVANDRLTSNAVIMVGFSLFLPTRTPEAQFSKPVHASSAL